MPTTTTNAAAPTASKPTPIRPAPSRAQLASTVVRTGDIPRSWIRHGHLTYDRVAAWPVSMLAKCVGISNTDRALVTTVESWNFDRSQADLLVRVSAYPSQRSVDADAAAAFRPKYAPCYLSWDRRHGITAPGAKISDVRARVFHRTSMQPASVVANLETSFVLSGHGTSDRIYGEEIWIRGRDTAATVDFINTDSPVPATFRAQVVAIVARRVARL